MGEPVLARRLSRLSITGAGEASAGEQVLQRCRLCVTTLVAEHDESACVTSDDLEVVGVTEAAGQGWMVSHLSVPSEA